MMMTMSDASATPFRLYLGGDHDGEMRLEGNLPPRHLTLLFYWEIPLHVWKWEYISLKSCKFFFFLKNVLNLFIF